MPFFLMPLPLTVDAPDVWGGFGIHVRQAAVLGLLGVGLGLLDRSGGRLRRLAPPGPVQGVLGAAVGGLTIWFAARMLAMPLAMLLGIGDVRWDDPWHPVWAPPAGILAAGVLLAVALWPGRSWARWFALPATLLAGAALGARCIAPFVQASPAGWRVGAGLGVLVAAVAWWRLPRASNDEVLRAVRGWVPWTPLLLALGAAAVVGGEMATVFSALAVEATGLLAVDDPTHWREPLHPPVLRLAWAYALLRAAPRLRLGERRFEGLALLSGAWGLYVAAEAGAMLLGPAAWAIGALAMGGLAVPGRLPRPAWWLAATPVVLTPGVARYALGLTIDPPGAGTLAFAAAPLVGFGVVRLAPFLVRAVARPPNPWKLAFSLPVAWVALHVPIYVVVFGGLEPLAFAAFVAALGGLLALGRGRVPGPVVPPLAVLWLLFYGSFAATMSFKGGPDADDCAALPDHQARRTLLSRFDAGPDYASVHPYDVLPMPEHGVAVASFKRYDVRGGFLEAIDLTDPGRRVRAVVSREDEGLPHWPERLIRNEANGRLFAQVIGVGAHGMWEFEAGEGPRLVETRRLPIQWEPGNPWFDPSRNELILTYVPNRAGGNPMVEAFDARTLESRGQTPRERRGLMSDFVTGDGVVIVVPTLFDWFRFGLSEIDPSTLQRTRHKELFHPSIGVAIDGERLFVTNNVAGTVDVYDHATLTRTHRLRSGEFPRDVALDPERGVLWVANYGEGTVVAFATRGEPRELARIPVGGLLRGVGVDSTTGKAYSAGGCGVYELSSP